MPGQGIILDEANAVALARPSQTHAIHLLMVRTTSAMRLQSGKCSTWVSTVRPN